ncbi:MAG TPA: hypothetical protein VKA68_17540 [bacterium]|nr:hypothetical protein [bacterium]
MDDKKIAVSTNDFKKLSGNTFGKSHYYQIFQMDDPEFEVMDTRENVLFRQVCDLTGRIEHLHGLLGDVRYLIGNQFQQDVKQSLQDLGHETIEAAPDSIPEVLEQFRASWQETQ